MASPEPSAALGDDGMPLIGGKGKDFVSEVLAREGPNAGIKLTLEAGSLPHPLAKHLIGFLDTMGVSRLEAHRAVLSRSKDTLLARVSSMNARSDKARLERLLAVSFPYLGMGEMREVPLAVMERLEAVPAMWLKQLAADKDIFKDLPRSVQRQVWEYDKNLLQSDALPLVGAYKYETATYMRALAADEFMPAMLATSPLPEAVPPGGAPGSGGGGGVGIPGITPGAGAASAAAAAAGATIGFAPAAGTAGGGFQQQGITRKILRKGSRVTQALKEMVGSSPKIYGQIVELCCVKFRDSDALYIGTREWSYATLRAQLLMALHDDSNPVATRDRCHELAWTLDAGIRNGCLTPKHLEKLGHFFDDMLATAQEAQREAGTGRKRGRGADRPTGGGRLPPLDEAESAGVGGAAAAGGAAEPLRTIADAGFVLRDPSAMHLLAAQAMMLLLGQVVAKQQLPHQVPELVLVCRLLQLAVECRQMMRDRVYRFPEADPVVLHDLLPLLAGCVVDRLTGELEQQQRHAAATAQGGAAARAAAAAAAAPPDPNVMDEVELDFPDAPTKAKVVQALRGNEVARRLVQMFVLERLGRQDYVGAAKVLRLLVAHAAPGSLAIEAADFASALAQRLADLAKSRRLEPASRLWLHGVDNLLIRAVDAHTQTHEEVLRLLLAAGVPFGNRVLLSAEEVGKYLAATLDNSKHSRKRYAKKMSEGLNGAAGWSGVLLSDIGSDIGSDGWPGILALKAKGVDGVRSVYDMFVRQVPGLTREAAPALHEYLDRSKGGGTTSDG